MRHYDPFKLKWHVPDMPYDLGDFHYTTVFNTDVTITIKLCFRIHHTTIINHNIKTLTGFSDLASFLPSLQPADNKENIPLHASASFMSLLIIEYTPI